MRECVTADTHLGSPHREFGPHPAEVQVSTTPHHNAQETPLLATKLYTPPVRREWVPRPRLVERLSAGLDRRLTLVSAPAGFGKTTLLSEWTRALGEGAAARVAWVSLDESDNDTARFWAYLIAALQTVHPHVGRVALGAVQSPRPPPIELLLTDLINEVARRPGRTVLVLDDLHLVASSEVHEGLVYLLDHLPEQMHIVLSSRADPPWPLARRRASGEMSELRARDLRFTPDEAAAFFSDAMALDLSEQDAAALGARAEGWIAGLQLAAISMQGQDAEHLSAFVSAFSGSNRLVLDYLVEEVLDRQPPTIQAFLLRTSILQRMTAPLCDALHGAVLRDTPDGPSAAVGETGSQVLLDQLERANLFLVPLDNERRWYRYHHLFAELLRGRMHQTHPDLVPVLHRRASEWFEAHLLTDEAIRHALAAHDIQRAADLVERNGMQMIVRSELSTLATWLDSLPDEAVRVRPWLCIYAAWARYYVGPRELVEPWLVNAERALERDPDGQVSALTEADRRHIAGHIAALRAYMALQNEELGKVAELAQRALDLLSTEDYARATVAIALAAQQAFGVLPQVGYARATSAIALAETPRERGDLAASERAYARARAIAEECGNVPMAVSAVAYMAYQQAKQGRLHRALDTNREALALAVGADGRELPAAGLPYVKMGDLMREWNELAIASRHLEKGIALCQQWGHADALVTGYTTLARAQLAQGYLDRARDTFHKAEQVARKTDVDPWAVCWVDDCRLRLWLAAGDLPAIVRWAETSGLAPDGALSFVRDLEHVNLARVLVAQGTHQPGGLHLDEALRLLSRLSDAAQEAGWVGRAIEVLVLRSLALDARGDDAGALEALDEALALAEPEGYVRVFLDEGALLVDLLARVPGERQAYAQQLRTAWAAGRAPPTAGGSTPGVSASDLVEPLTEREMEVFRLLTSELTNPEIARELTVSVNTVRTHIQHIYGKLSVHSRYEAVARARELGLL